MNGAYDEGGHEEDDRAPHRRGAHRGRGHPALPGLGTGHRRAPGRGAAGGAGGRRSRRAGGEARPSRPGARPRSRGARGSCSPSASSCNSTRRRACARIVSSEHGKVFEDAKGEVVRGLEVVEFACGLPQLLKGEFSDQVSAAVDAYSFRQPLGVCAGHHPVQLPGDGADVDAPGRDRDREHVRAQALRARPLGLEPGRRAVPPRPAFPTASSTSSTATRSRSTRCSTTPTSPRVWFVGSTPDRPLHPRTGDRAGQARPGARRREEPRRRAARRRPRVRRRPADRRRLRLGRSALHGDLGRRRGR